MDFVKKFLVCLVVFYGKFLKKSNKCALLSSHIPIQNLGDQALVIGSLNGLSRFKEITLIRTGSDSCKELIKKIDLPLRNLSVVDDLYLAFATKRAFLERLKMYVLIARHKECYAIGADVLDGVYNADEIELFFENISLISKMNVKVTIIGSSFSNNISRQSINGLKSIPKNVRVYARDQYSLERIRPYCNAELTADAAFLMAPAEFFKVYEESTGHLLDKNVNSLTIGVCIKDNEFSTLCDEDSFTDCLVELSKRFDLTLIALPHHKNDLLKLNNIFNRFSHESIKLVRPSSLPSAPEIKRKCKDCDIVITGRMHVAIAALSQIVPVICYSYGDKFSGLLEHFGLPDKNLIVSQNASLNYILDYCILERERLVGDISNRLNQVYELSKNNFI